MNRIIMTGAAGNTGSRVLRRILEHRPELMVLCVMRDTELDDDLRSNPNVEEFFLSDENLPIFLEKVRPGDVFVETANLRVADRLLPLLADQGLTRAFCVTTTAVFSEFHSYSRHYREIEDRLRTSLAEVTILRPSMIYGNSRDHNMHRLIRFLTKTPVFPVFGSGTALMQPVHVDDLAWGISEAVLKDARGEFNLAGPQPITYREVLETIASELRKRVFLLSVNHGLAANVVRFAEKLPMFPVRHEQVMRLLEDKSFSIVSAETVFGYEPRSFRDGIRQQIDESRLVNR